MTNDANNTATPTTTVREAGIVRPRNGRDRFGRYTMTLIENVQTGANMGAHFFSRLAPVTGNGNVWDVVYMDGIRYTETRGAYVRVYA